MCFPLRFPLVAALCSLTTPLFAAQIACPLDGTPVEVVESWTCEKLGSTLSLRVRTDCDDLRATPPACAATGLPLYTRFTPPEVEALAGFVTTPAYLAATNGWERAVLVADHLAHWEQSAGFLLAVNLLWWQPEALRDRADWQARFLRAGTAELARREAGQGGGKGAWAFTQGQIALVLILTGQDAAAAAHLSQARAAPGLSATQAQWLDHLDTCLGRAEATDCQPDAPLVSQ